MKKLSVKTAEKSIIKQPTIVHGLGAIAINKYAAVAVMLEKNGKIAAMEMKKINIGVAKNAQNADCKAVECAFKMIIRINDLTFHSLKAFLIFIKNNYEYLIHG